MVQTVATKQVATIQLCRQTVQETKHETSMKCRANAPDPDRYGDSQVNQQYRIECELDDVYVCALLYALDAREKTKTIDDDVHR